VADDSRYGLSIRYFQSAVFSAREAVRIQGSGKESEEDGFYRRIGVGNNEAGYAVGCQDPHWPSNVLRSYACSAVLFSTGSIEARINSFFLDAEERASNLRFLGDSALRGLDLMWNAAGVRRWTRPLDKMQLALEVCGVGKLNAGRIPFQDAHLMFTLRNHLVHFHPEWTSEQKSHAKLEQALRTKGFRPSPFAHGHDPVFPAKCLAADLAVWCVRTTYCLVADFLERIGDKGAIQSWTRQEYYIRDFHDWEQYARWEGDGGPPWTHG